MALRSTGPLTVRVAQPAGVAFRWLRQHATVKTRWVSVANDPRVVGGTTATMAYTTARTDKGKVLRFMCVATRGGPTSTANATSPVFTIRVT